jgi:hypothetical protein|tara:strand:+ start:44419 stop:45576 length:1158 start_codon:yes stop_codon:yes gene_type:complete
MHFVESMSLFSGLKSKRPLIEEAFFPVALDKYITICTENHQSKQWDHFQEYVNLILPILKKQNIGIVEIGKNQAHIGGVTILKGATNENHWSFIIKNSLLHIGPENFIASLAAYHNVPLISLFSNTSPEYAAPNWIDSSAEQIFVTPDIENHKPSFSGQENKKTINRIHAEDIAAKTLNFLGIENDFDRYAVFSTGQFYHVKVVEVVPNFAPQPNFFAKSLINIRLDYHFDLNLVPHFANQRKVGIVSDKEIDINLLNQIKPNLDNLFFKIDESSNIEYFNFLKQKGFKVNLIAKETADLSETRFNFFDWEVSEENKKDKKDLDNFDKICDTTRYKSSKMIFSKDGQFSSKSSYDRGINTHDDQIIIDDQGFWNDADHYKLYNLK